MDDVIGYAFRRHWPKRVEPDLERDVGNLHATSPESTKHLLREMQACGWRRGQTRNAAKHRLVALNIPVKTVNVRRQRNLAKPLQAHQSS